MDTELLKNIFAIVGAVITCASVIVKITPSQKDDAVLSKVIKIFDWLSVFNPNGKVVVSKDDVK